MNANQPETWIKCLAFLVISGLFATTSAQAAGGCENSLGKMERVAALSPAPGADSATVSAAASVQDKLPNLSKEEAAFSTLLALHCEAVSNVLMGQPLGGYHKPGCGNSSGGIALQ
ncbi:MAG: hypothetical protein MUF80_00200 [Burkholderiales bacterium]|jgi:hypothetical protein|nr:hypothetical protein [Burkholderiales bacterium]